MHIHKALFIKCLRLVSKVRVFVHSYMPYVIQYIFIVTIYANDFFK